jgi:predicted secreted protein
VYQQSYHTCTPAAELAIRRYLEEGAKIAREVTARYAN